MNRRPRIARVQALAKINLDLRVLHKRPDGYHELRTIYQTISLGDQLEIELTPARHSRVELACKEDIPDNLVVRAARLALGAMRLAAEVRFRLKKRIPMGAGLGGGSSDAAAVLLALPVLAGRPLPMGVLLRLAGELGSDVPFFLLGGTAVGVGRGTELYPLPDEQPATGVLVTPGVPVSTAEAYRALGRKLTFAAPQNTMNSFLSCAWRMGVDAPAGEWRERPQNDFEPVIFRRHPRLRSLKRRLEELGADPAMMTGSGSALFGLFRVPGELEEALLSLEQESARRIAFVSRARYRSLWWRWLRPHIKEKLWPPTSRYTIPTAATS